MLHHRELLWEYSMRKSLSSTLGINLHRFTQDNCIDQKFLLSHFGQKNTTKLLVLKPLNPHGLSK